MASPFSSSSSELLGLFFGRCRSQGGRHERFLFSRSTTWAGTFSERRVEGEAQPRTQGGAGARCASMASHPPHSFSTLRRVGPARTSLGPPTSAILMRDGLCDLTISRVAKIKKRNKESSSILWRARNTPISALLRDGEPSGSVPLSLGREADSGFHPAER